MQIFIRLAGFEAPWRFIDSGRLDLWFAGRPWLSNGGVVGLRVSGPHQVNLIRAALPDAVRAVDGGASEVMCRCTALAPGEPVTAIALITGVLGIDVPAGRERLEAVANSLDVQPRVLLIDASAAAREIIDQVWRELDSLRMQFQKLRRSAALTAVILHEQSTALPGLESFEMDLGGPAVALVEARLDRRSWRRATYLHSRIAWEAGGQVDRTLSWESRLSSDAGALDGEDVLEAALNRLALEEWHGLPVQRARDVLEIVHRGSAGRGRALDDARLVSRLAELRLFWRPLGSGAARPVPWVARAILLKERASNAHALLRAALVCAPLLREALVRCLDLEARMRVFHRADLMTDTPADEDGAASRAFDAFKRPNSSFDQQFYPRACPAGPRDVWAFEEFGGFLRSIHVSRPRQEALNRLRLLRNSLAHGHFVSWRTFEILDALEGELGE